VLKAALGPYRRIFVTDGTADRKQELLLETEFEKGIKWRVDKMAAKK
jgi:hypothetical protein